jgi:hypothetical protein
MATVEDVFKQYEKLRCHCDGFWERVWAHCADDLRCRKGCCDCCRLEGVSALEAAVLLAGCRELGISGERAADDQQDPRIFCPFLRQGECLVYRYRPLICRTHGLAITGRQLTGGRIDCCPHNFSLATLATLDRAYVLDVDMITDNLMRLNLAFCLVLSDAGLADQRFELADIRAGQIPAILFL